MKTKSDRWTSSFSETRTLPDASLPPHMEHLKPKRRGRHANSANRAGASGRRNGTVDFVRALESPARKRGGAKYGPAPENPPRERMQAPKPMTDNRRDEVYGRTRWTARKLRQFGRMGAHELYREYRQQHDGRADVDATELRELVGRG